MAHRPRTVADLLAEHPETQRLRLGPVVFHMNPNSYEQTSERVIAVAQTANGVGRYSYGNKPREYVLAGATGLAGVHGPGGVQDLRQFEPQPGKPDTLWPLEFPGEFRGKRWVKVTSFKLTRQASSQFYHDYEIRLQEYPRELMVSGVKVPGTILSSPLPVGG